MTEDQEIEFIIEEDKNELNMYTHISNNLYIEYFVGYEVAVLLGYKDTNKTIRNNVSKCNQLIFKDYPGVKEPKLDPRVILITRDGVGEILLKTHKRISSDVLNILKKFNIDITNHNISNKPQNLIKKKVEFIEKDEDAFIIEEDEKDLTTYSYISNYLCFEYFVGYEIASLLGYKNPAQTILNNVSKCNQLEFKNYPGVKEPKLDPRVILITRDGAVEILLKTRKRISPDVLHILKKFNIDTTNRKCLTKEQQTLSSITDVFKTEKFEDQFKIGPYYLDLYFSEHKIINECDENGHADRKPYKERERMDYVNKTLDIDDSHWIRFNPDAHDFDITRVIGQIYRKIDEIKEKKYLKMLEEKKVIKEKQTITDLNMFSYTDKNGICIDYFVGYEVATLLGYKQVNEINKYAKKCNIIEFRNFLGEKDPRLNPKATLLTRDGVIKILLNTQKRVTAFAFHLFKKYNFNIQFKNDRHKIELIKEDEEKQKDDVTSEETNMNVVSENDMIKNIKNAFVSEKCIEQFEIKDKYKVNLYFPEYKIILDNNKEPERFLNINDFLKINDTFWISYDDTTETSQIIGQIYALMKTKCKVVYQICTGCHISKELADYHKNSYNPLKVEYNCKVCRSAQNKKRLDDKREKDEKITESYCEKCDKTLPIINFWKSINFKNGYYKFCKTCGKDHRKNQQDENKKEPDDFRKCTKCEIIKKKEEYGKNLESYDGLNTFCIPCHKKIVNKKYNDNRNPNESKQNVLNIFYDKNKVKYFLAVEIAKIIGYNRTDHVINGKISLDNKFNCKDKEFDRKIKNSRSILISHNGVDELVKTKILNEKMFEKIKKIQDCNNTDEILIIDE